MTAPSQPAPSQTASGRSSDGTDQERYQEALRYLHGRINYERLAGTKASNYSFRLQRVADLMRLLNLQSYLDADTDRAKVPLVHIAGTKGKGSVAAMVAAALTACGWRTGLYTSPHLHQLEERFRIDGTPCDPGELVAMVERVKSAAKQVEKRSGAPSFFELTTAMAMMHFDACQCDALVIEVGLGGRLDSTNVLAASVSVVTSIGLDHQHVLGHDLKSIAGEKAGIIKRGIPVVSGITDREAARVVQKRADEFGAKLYWLGRDFQYESESLPGWGSLVRYSGMTPPLLPEASLKLGMEGDHQAKNAAIALATLDLLRNQIRSGPITPAPVAPAATGASSHPASDSQHASHHHRSSQKTIPRVIVESSLATLQCDARIEHAWLEPNLLTIIDVSHNEDSIKALCHCLRQRSSNRPITVVFGTSLDKDAELMLHAIKKVADHLILTRFHSNPRARPPEQLMHCLEADNGRDSAQGPSAMLVEDPIEACRRGTSLAASGGTLVVCGSFFLVAETRQWLLQQPRARAEQIP